MRLRLIVTSITVVALATSCGDSTGSDETTAGSTQGSTSTSNNDSTGLPTVVPGTSSGPTSASSSGPGPGTTTNVADSGSTANGTTDDAESGSSESTGNRIDCDAGNGTEFDVTNEGAGAYVINGIPNPNLVLRRGCTYFFHVATPGHPFLIKEVQSAGVNNTFDEGVANQGAEMATLAWSVPLDAPDTLFYNCQFHPPMTGQLLITSP